MDALVQAVENNSVAISILIGTAALWYRLGQLSSKLDGLNNVDRLIGMLDGMDVGQLSRRIRHVSEEIDDMSHSINTIEASIKRVDFQGLQAAVEELLDGGAHTGNSVEYTLPESEIDVVFSLSNRAPEKTIFEVRTSHGLEADTVQQQLTENNEKINRLTETVQTEFSIQSYAPYAFEVLIRTDDMDRISEFIEELVTIMDEIYKETRSLEDTFDERVASEIGGTVKKD